MLIKNSVPEKVQSLLHTAATTTAIALLWDEVVGTAPKTYSITWIPNDGTGSVSDISGTSTIITGLTSNTMYSFQVQAVNAGGEGELSDQYIALTSTFVVAECRPFLFQELYILMV